MAKKEDKELMKRMKEQAKLEEKLRKEEEKRKKEEEKLRKKGKLPEKKKEEKPKEEKPKEEKPATVEELVDSVPATEPEIDPETGKKKDDAFSVGSNVAEMDIAADWESMLRNTQNWLYLPFSHGMEMELIICDAEGKYIEGEEMVYRMEEITRSAKDLIIKVINN